jgi:hypothetical protein
MKDCKPVSTPIDLSADLDDVPKFPNNSPLQELYASLIRALMFLSIATRPDIILAVVKLATYISKPGQAHWVAVKQILRYLKGTKDLNLPSWSSILIVLMSQSFTKTPAVDASPNLIAQVDFRPKT